jgi:lipopolysaccharide/colanic/teichoic acid biosynthesis glycosyltransferase
VQAGLSRVAPEVSRHKRDATTSMETGTMEQGAGAVLQRVLERVLAGALALLTLPLLAVVLATSALTYRAWPIFSHQRLGRHNRPFSFPKVRTLPPDTDRYADKYSIDAEALPWPMAIVRRTHLDELPQLWLVAIGRMALVGPRPEMATLADRLPPALVAERATVRPGITGLWQVSPYCTGLICERPEIDILYVRHRNPRLDAWILARTVPKVLFGSTTPLHEIPAWSVRPAQAAATPPAPTPRELDPHPALSLGVID